MFYASRHLFSLTAVLALALNACSANPARVAGASTQPMECAGGIIRAVGDAARFTGCTSVSGDLRVEHTTLADLSALAALENVSGALIVAANSELGDVTGLEHLRAVGSLRVSGNSELGDLSSLRALRSAGVVSIERNPELRDLRGLEGLARIDTLELVGNGLVDTAGLSKLREVNQLTITDNRRLISLHGLDGLQRAGTVQIRDNPVLCAQLGFLPQLAAVTQALVVSSNAGITRREVASLNQHVHVQLDPSSHDRAREMAMH